MASAHKSASVAAKHGLLGLVRTIAVEGAPVGVTATAVCPGYVRTPLAEQQVAAHAELHGIAPERVIEDVLLAGQPPAATELASALVRDRPTPRGPRPPAP